MINQNSISIDEANLNHDYTLDNLKYDMFGALKKELVVPPTRVDLKKVPDISLAINQLKMFKETISAETQAMIASLDCY